MIEADNEEELDNLLDDNDFLFMNSSKLAFLLDDNSISCKQRLSYLDHQDNY